MFEDAKKLQDKLSKIGDKEPVQVAELLEMQQVLDEKILKEHGKEEYPEDEIKLALFTELGEFLQEVPEVFKYWKKTAVNDREKALEEYADVLHFALSLANHNAGTIIENLKWLENHKMLKHSTFYYSSDAITYSDYWKERSSAEAVHEIIINIVNGLYEPISGVFQLGNYFGFTWNEVYKAYMDKNSVNHIRVEEGY